MFVGKFRNLAAAVAYHGSNRTAIGVGRHLFFVVFEVTLSLEYLCGRSPPDLLDVMKLEEVKSHEFSRIFRFDHGP